MADPARPMRVLHFVQAGTRNPLLMDLVEELRRAGIENHVGSLFAPGDLHRDADAAGFSSLSLRAPCRSAYPRAVRNLAVELRRRRIDVVHTHTVDASLVGLTAARIARTPVRVMTRHHAFERQLYRSRTGQWLDRLVSTLADEVIAVSDAVRRAAVEVDGTAARKVTVVANGYDWSRVRASADGARRVRGEFGISEHFVFCAVGRLTAQKGYDVLLRAFAEAQLPEHARLLIVGSGPEESRLRAVSDQFGLAGRCMFTGFRRDVFDVMAAADILVHPSFDEALCQVILEAFAIGRPVIATDVGAARDVVLPDRTGWLVPPRDSGALVHALEAALAQAARLHEFGRAGQELTLARYPIEAMGMGYRRMYQRLLRAARPCKLEPTSGDRVEHHDHAVC